MHLITNGQGTGEKGNCVHTVPVDKAMLTGTPGLGRRHLWNKKIALT